MAWLDECVYDVVLGGEESILVEFKLGLFVHLTVLFLKKFLNAWVSYHVHTLIVDALKLGIVIFKTLIDEGPLRLGPTVLVVWSILIIV